MCKPLQVPWSCVGGCLMTECCITGIPKRYTNREVSLVVWALHWYWASTKRHDILNCQVEARLTKGSHHFYVRLQIYRCSNKKIHLQVSLQQHIRAVTGDTWFEVQLNETRFECEMWDVNVKNHKCVGPFPCTENAVWRNSRLNNNWKSTCPESLEICVYLSDFTSNLGVKMLWYRVKSIVSCNS